MTVPPFSFTPQKKTKKIFFWGVKEKDGTVVPLSTVTQYRIPASVFLPFFFLKAVKLGLLPKKCLL